MIKEENLQKNSQEVGTYMILKFAELREEFDIVGDVRGKGLLIGIEMVQDKVRLNSCLGGCLGPVAGNVDVIGSDAYILSKTKKLWFTICNVLPKPMGMMGRKS